MTSLPASESAILILWITFSVVALFGAVAALLWAVRTRQFSDQDRARYLPLRSGIPEPPATGQGGGAGRKGESGRERGGHYASP